MSGTPLSELKRWKDLPDLDAAPLTTEGRSMITLRMLRTVDGSLNGRDVSTYVVGETYELPDQGPDGLADVFLREGWAGQVAEQALPPAPAQPEPAAAAEPALPKPSRRRK